MEPKLLKGTTLYGDTPSAEDAMRIGAVRYDSKDMVDKKMYLDAARRVIFKNCMASCDLDNETLPNFNSKFYYTMPGEQKCLQTCFNTKINLHFGEQTAKKDALYMDFQNMKNEFKSMQAWNPNYNQQKLYEKGEDEAKVAEVTAKLLKKTKAQQAMV